MNQVNYCSSVSGLTELLDVVMNPIEQVRHFGVDARRARLCAAVAPRRRTEESEAT